MNKDTILYDATVRSVDANGYMMVDVSNISKAVVNPYFGHEIDPDGALGLKPDQTYYLLRDPAELAKGASTFNKLPLLDLHHPLSADEFDKDKQYVVGTTGEDARFEYPYLKNSLAIWDEEAKKKIESKKQFELSCAYRYDIDMTPGMFEGTRYDGRMKNIRGNHVALVEEGRAGHDVCVQDAKPAQLSQGGMSMKDKAKDKLAQDIKDSVAPDATLEEIKAELDKIELAQDKKAKDDDDEGMLADDDDKEKEEEEEEEDDDSRNARVDGGFVDRDYEGPH